MLTLPLHPQALVFADRFKFEIFEATIDGCIGGVRLLCCHVKSTETSPITSTGISPVVPYVNTMCHVTFQHYVSSQ